MTLKRSQNSQSDLKMADVSDKTITKRTALAQGTVYLKKETIEAIIKGRIFKGNVLISAKLSGIMAAKNTPQLIPLCHPLELTNIKVNFKINKKSIDIQSEVCCIGKTGVEMEALVCVSIACLTIYDMCKPVDKDIIISEIKLLKKTGGKSGTYVRK